MTPAQTARCAFALLIVLGPFLITQASTALAQAPPAPPGLTVTTVLEPEEPRVGERVRLTIEVAHPADLLVSLVAEPATQPDLELIEVQPASMSPATSSASGDMARTSFVIVVAPFALGEIDAGAVTLQALREDGTAQEFAVALPSMQVRSTLQVPH